MSIHDLYLVVVSESRFGNEYELSANWCELIKIEFCRYESMFLSKTDYIINRPKC